MDQPATDRNLVRRIFLLAVAAFASGASARIGDPLMPQLADTFSKTTGQVAYVVSGFALAYGAIQLLYGPLGDRFGKFRVVTFATIASALCVLASAIAGTFEMLVWSRVLTGATAAALMPLSMAWIGDSVPYDKRQPVLAYFLTGNILGVIGGQMIGGICADYTGWRGAFWALFFVYLIAAGLLLKECYFNPISGRQLSDVQPTRPSISHIADIFSIGWCRLILSSVCLEGAALFGALAFIPTFLHKEFGISLAASGASVAAFGIGGLSYAVLSKRLVRALGQPALSAGGGILMGISFFSLSLLDSTAFVIFACWCSGFGFYMLHNTLQTTATQMVATGRGTAMSLFASCFFIGQSLGVGFAASIIDRFGSAALFTTSALLLPITGCFFAYKLKRKQQNV